MRKALFGLVATALVSLGTVACTDTGSSPDTRRPNLLLIVVDDQRVGTMHMMPETARRFPVVFTNAFTTTPNCCPSRSSILSGEYAHNTLVTKNGYLQQWQDREVDSLGPWLQSEGYYTGLVGKYFNGYGSDDATPPGWDEFYVRAYDVGDGLSRMGLREHYTDENGHQHDETVSYPNDEHPDFYSTTLFSEKATDFIAHVADSDYNPDDKPFALVVATTSPNTARVEGKYASAPIPQFDPPPSFMEKRLGDKPPEVRNSPFISTARHHRMIRARQLRQLPSIDDLVGDLWGRIDDEGWRDRTWGLYFSDNGRLWGEHRLRRKYFAYEESAQVPLRMAMPGGGVARIDELVAGIDIAPTMMRLAGDESLHRFDGRSLLPLARDERTRWRSSVLIENDANGVRYQAIRTRRWKLIKWLPSRRLELYDLRRDPYEMNNVARRHPEVASKLGAELKVLASS